jgi:hypothetical protein
MLIRSIIDNPANIREDRKNIDPASLEGKNAGPTGCVLMVDANRESARQKKRSSAGVGVFSWTDDETRGFVFVQRSGMCLRLSSTCRNSSQ